VGKLRVLIACEFSGVVRHAFRTLGHDAWSCDLLPAEGGDRHHYQCNVLDILGGRPLGGFIDSAGFFCHRHRAPWDLLIAHPPCTDLAVSGARHFAAKIADGRQQKALDFVQMLLDAPIPHIALENPVSIISSRIRKPDQIIQPWMFGHGETKATCLWLKNLPKLVPTNIVEGREARVHRMSPGPDRWKERSRTLTGIAEAMADQWGAHVEAALEARNAA
jgi:site-specific DNA-cytosine methylase